MRRTRRVLAVALGATLALTGLGVGLASPAGAVACTLDQLTLVPAGGVISPTISDDGSRVAFHTASDLTGGNPDENVEVFLYDRDTDVVSQLTNTTGGIGSREPVISGDGTKVAFRSDRNFGGSNADGNSEIFLYTIATNTTTAVTSSTGGTTGNVDASINEDGTSIAFRSDRTYGGQNADLNTEIWVWHPGQATNPLAITNTTAGGLGNNTPAISASGRRVAFMSDRPLTVANTDANPEIWLKDLDSGVLSQLTFSSSPIINNSPDIDGSGTKVTYTSSFNPFGQNNDGSAEIFVFDSTGPSTVQATHTTGAGMVGARIDGVGDRAVHIGFPGTVVESGAEGGSSETDLYVTDQGGTERIVDSPALHAADMPQINEDGTRIAFKSDANLTGHNFDQGNEIFMSTCGAATPAFTDVSRSNVFFDQIQWMTAAGVATGFPDGTYRPQDSVKRQQMAGFLYNLYGQPAFTPPTTPTFTDVPPSNPFYLQIEWMVDEGIASGFPDHTFRPQDFVKRQQMAGFLFQVGGAPDIAVPPDPTFSDVPSSNPFYQAIEWMASEGVATGFPDGTFRPQDFVKRQQMANFVFNVARLGCPEDCEPLPS